MKTTCPCCSQSVELVRGDVLEAHPLAGGEPHGVAAGPRRAGPYCNGSGYTVAQANRWLALPIHVRQKLVDSPWGPAEGRAVAS